MHDRTPAEMRSTYRAELSRVLRRSLDRHDLTQAQLADHVGTTPQKVARWCDHRSPEVPGASDIVLMPCAVARDVLAWVTQPHHLHLVDELAVERVADHLQHLHTCIREGADVTSTYAAALRDGGIDPAERRELLAELGEDIAAKTALRRTLLADEAAHLERMRRTA